MRAHYTVVAQIVQVPMHNMTSLGESTSASLQVENLEHQGCPVEQEKSFNCQNLAGMLQQMLRTGSYPPGKTMGMQYRLETVMICLF